MLTHPLEHQVALQCIALICLNSGISPTDLEFIALKLAEYDAVCDAITDGENHVTSH